MILLYLLLILSFLESMSLFCYPMLRKVRGDFLKSPHSHKKDRKYGTQ